MPQTRPRPSPTDPSSPASAPAGGGGWHARHDWGWFSVWRDSPYSVPIHPSADSLPSRVHTRRKNTPESHGVAQQRATPCDVSLHITWCGKARVAETAIFSMTGEWARNRPWPHQPQNRQKSHGVVQARARWQSVGNHPHTFSRGSPIRRSSNGTSREGGS